MAAQLIQTKEELLVVQTSLESWLDIQKDLCTVSEFTHNGVFHEADFNSHINTIITASQLCERLKHLYANW